MAITITTQPADSIEEGHNLFTCLRPLVYDVSSGLANCVNIIADIFIEGAYSGTRTLPVDGSRDAVFDFSGFVEDYLTDLILKDDLVIPAKGSSAPEYGNKDFVSSVVVNFFEETENASTGLLETTWTADGGTTPVSGAIATAINVALVPVPKHSTQEDAWIGDQYYAGNTVPGSFSRARFMSAASSSMGPNKLPEDADAYLMLFLGGSSDNHVIRVDSFDSAGASVGSFSGDLHDVPASSEGLAIFPIGPGNIADKLSLSIPSNVASYRLACYNSSTSERVTEFAWFEIDRACYPSSAIFHYIGHRGGLETFYARGEQMTVRVPTDDRVIERFGLATSINAVKRNRIRIGGDPTDRFDFELVDLTASEMLYLRGIRFSNYHLVDLEDTRHWAFVVPGREFEYDDVVRDIYEDQSLSYILERVKTAKF